MSPSALIPSVKPIKLTVLECLQLHSRLLQFFFCAAYCMDSNLRIYRASILNFSK